jgi:hypothetical protein
MREMLELSNQALRSGAPVEVYVLSALSWALFRDFTHSVLPAINLGSDQQ